MSSPSKNYTLPTTGPVKQPMVLPIPRSAANPVVINASSVGGNQMKALVVLIPSAKMMHIVPTKLIGIMNQAADNTPPQKPPKPPMGKMLINTFPSIYKIAGGQHSLVNTARQYPPIYIMHSTTK